jgi:hypothetical protein
LGKFLRWEQHKYHLTRNSGILSGDIFKNSVEFIFVEFKTPTCNHAKYIITLLSDRNNSRINEYVILYNYNYICTIMMGDFMAMETYTSIQGIHAEWRMVGWGMA